MRVLSKPDDARSWLHEHNLREIDPTPLLVARLAARQRAIRFQLVLIPVLIFVILGIGRQVGGAWNPDRTDTSVIMMVVFATTIILSYGLQSWRQHRNERSLLARMTVRTAHPVAASATQLIGARWLTATAWGYGAGLVLGVGTVVLAPQPADRAVGLAFLIGVVVLAGLSTATLAAVLRRPSLAEDSDSLRVDDALRVEDARAAIAPWPLWLAWGVIFNNSEGARVIWPFAGYVVVGLALWLIVAVARDWPAEAQ